MPSVETNRMLAVAAAACEDKKAEDIRIMALDPAESGLTDYFLICTGTNDRQTVAITDEIEIRLKREFSTYPNSVEGRRQGEWILMDYVDFIVHVFLPEKRAYYGLERLRPSATSLSVNELNSEVKAAITAGRSGARSAKAAGAEKTPAKKSVAKKAAAKSAPAKSVAKKSTPGKTAAKTPARKSPAKKSSAKASLKLAGKTSTRSR